jgi:hypothetical protein
MSAAELQAARVAFVKAGDQTAIESALRARFGPRRGGARVQALDEARLKDKLTVGEVATLQTKFGISMLEIVGVEVVGEMIAEDEPGGQERFDAFVRHEGAVLETQWRRCRIAGVPRIRGHCSGRHRPNGPRAKSNTSSRGKPRSSDEPPGEHVVLAGSVAP